MDDLIGGDRVHQLLARLCEARHRPAVPVLHVAAFAGFPVLRKDHLAAAVLRIIDHARLQRAAVIGEHRIRIGDLLDRRRSGAERGRKIGFVLADAHAADHLDHRFHADEARRAHRHQVARLFEAPAHRVFAAAARIAEVAEAFVTQRRALIDAEGPIDDHRRGSHAVVERGGIDEGFDRRAGLAFGLRRAIERRQADVEAALHRIDAARMRAFDDHAARHLGDIAKRITVAARRFDDDQIARAQRRKGAAAVVVGRRNARREAEAFRYLRTSIEVATDNEIPLVVAFTSSSANEGKSVTAANYALATARADRTVAILDGDLLNSSVADLFEAEGENAFLALMNGEVDASTENWHRISTSGAPVDLMVSRKMALSGGRQELPTIAVERSLEKLVQVYDTVVLDCPPVLAVSDAMVLTRAADVAVMVVRMGKTTRRDLDKALTQLEQNKIDIAGIVITHSTDESESYYGYGYAYGGRDD